MSQKCFLCRSDEASLRLSYANHLHKHRRVRSGADLDKGRPVLSVQAVLVAAQSGHCSLGIGRPLHNGVSPAIVRPPAAHRLSSSSLRADGPAFSPCMIALHQPSHSAAEVAMLCRCCTLPGCGTHACRTRWHASAHSSGAPPSGFQHEGSAEGVHGRLQVGRAADAAEVRDWDARTMEVLLLQELVLQQPEPSAADMQAPALMPPAGTVCGSALSSGVRALRLGCQHGSELVPQGARRRASSCQRECAGEDLFAHPCWQGMANKDCSRRGRVCWQVAGERGSPACHMMPTWISLSVAGNGSTSTLRSRITSSRALASMCSISTVRISTPSAKLLRTCARHPAPTLLEQRNIRDQCLAMCRG